MGSMSMWKDSEPPTVMAGQRSVVRARSFTSSGMGKGQGSSHHKREKSAHRKTERKRAEVWEQVAPTQLLCETSKLRGAMQCLREPPFSSALAPFFVCRPRHCSTTHRRRYAVRGSHLRYHIFATYTMSSSSTIPHSCPLSAESARFWKGVYGGSPLASMQRDCLVPSFVAAGIALESKSQGSCSLSHNWAAGYEAGGCFTAVDTLL